MIELKNVSKKYGNFLAVKNANFEIDEGEIIGLLGPNGAGKTTIMNMITGFIEPTDGEININGINIENKPAKAKQNIGYMPEGVPLYMDMTPYEFVKFMAELKKINKKDRKEAIEKALKNTGTDVVSKQLIRNLSRGYKQRVSMAGAIVGEPQILIFDEPTVGLDPKQITEIRELIKSFSKNHTVIFSSHILSEVSQICNKVIIINKGEIVAIDTPENLESKTTSTNAIEVIIEDLDNKIDSLNGNLAGINEMKFINENSDGSKKYLISGDKEIDLRKIMFDAFSKAGITILEMKKNEATLEDAFIKLISEEQKEGGEE